MVKVKEQQCVVQPGKLLSQIPNKRAKASLLWILPADR
jgi:hypothetical protein